MKATNTIPIIGIDLESDPAASGWVKSLARPLHLARRDREPDYQRFLYRRTLRARHRVVRCDRDGRDGCAWQESHEA
jgi:hypothetical protein